nr:MAG TPA: hypothetical protein [Caudoviricetes sp.]
MFSFCLYDCIRKYAESALTAVIPTTTSLCLHKA